jgi:hypothetical protein
MAWHTQVEGIKILRPRRVEGISFRSTASYRVLLCPKPWSARSSTRTKGSANSSSRGFLGLSLGAVRLSTLAAAPFLPPLSSRGAACTRLIRSRCAERAGPVPSVFVGCTRVIRDHYRVILGSRLDLNIVRIRPHTLTLCYPRWHATTRTANKFQAGASPGRMGQGGLPVDGLPLPPWP